MIGRVREIQALAQPPSAAPAAPAPPVATAPAGATPASFASQLQQAVTGQQPGVLPAAATTPPAPAGLSAPTTPAAVTPPGTTVPAGVPAQLAPLVQQAAAANGVDPALVAAVARAESNFDPSAVSRAGAQGLMQLMPATAAGLGVTDPFDPAQNLNGGARYLRQMLDRFGGDVRLALAGYNAGPGAVARYGGIPPYAETRAYVQRVTGYLDADRAGGVA